MVCSLALAFRDAVTCGEIKSSGACHNHEVVAGLRQHAEDADRFELENRRLHRRSDRWERVSERLAWHLSETLAVLEASGIRIVPTHGDDGTKALADFRSMIPPDRMIPRDYE